MSNKLYEALKKVKDAYCGIGNFEGTGENMAGIMPFINQALSAYEAQAKTEEELVDILYKASAKQAISAGLMTPECAIRALCKCGALNVRDRV